MTERKNKKAVRMISFTLSFFFAVLTLALFTLVQLNLGIGSSRNLQNSINDSNYTEAAYEEVLAKSKAYMKERSMPENIVTAAVTEGQFYVDSSKSIKAALGGKSSLVDTTDLEKTLQRNIDRYLDDYNIVKDENIKMAREEIVQTVAGYYKSCAQFRFGEYFYSMNEKLNQISPVAIPALIILMTLTAFVLIKIQKFRHRGFRYLACSLFTATWVNLIMGVKLFFFDQVNGDVEAAYYLEFSCNFLRSGIQITAVVTAAGAVLFLITLLFANRHKLAGKVS